jgi:MFS transporter, ACS family, pantothenate transporter
LFGLEQRLTPLHSWIFVLFWVIGGALEAFCNQSCMLIWMKASGEFTVAQNNNYFLGVTAIGRSFRFQRQTTG